MAREIDMEDLRKKLLIDKHSLDEEIEHQAEVYYEIAEQAVLAKSRMDAAEEELKQIQAQLDGVVRREAEEAEEKITEAGVRAAVIQHRDYKKSSQNALKAREEFEKLSALRDAFRQRSSMLRDLVELHVSGYYTERSIRSSANKHSDEKVERIRSRMNEKREGRSKEKRHGSD